MTLPLLWRRALLGLLGVLIIGGGTVGVLWTMQVLSDPEDVLPAMATVAFWKGTDMQALEAWKGHFPELASLPQAVAPFDIAIVATRAGSFWVLFPNETDAALRAKRSATTRGRALLTSAPDPRSVLAVDGRALSASADFAPLVRNIDQDHFAYFDLRQIALGATEKDQRLFSFLRTTDATAVLIGSAGDRRTVRFAAGAMEQEQATTLQNIPHLSPAPRVLVSSSDLLSVLPSFLAPATADPTITYGLLSSATERIAGKDVSVRADIAPLLSDPSFVALGGSGSTQSLLFAGSADPTLLTTAFERFHDHQRAAQGSVQEIPRVYEGKNQGLSLSQDGERLQTTADSRNGWSIHITADNAGHGLFTALRDRSFVLATDRAWFDQAIASTAESSVSLPSLPGERLKAGGIAARQSIDPFLPTASLSALLFAPLLPVTGPVLWSVSSGVGTVSVMMGQG